jgi:hypothetical protein
MSSNWQRLFRIVLARSSDRTGRRYWPGCLQIQLLESPDSVMIRGLCACAMVAQYGDGVLFEEDTAVLIIVISLIIGVFITAGVLLGRRMRETSPSDHQRESLGVI